MPAEKRSPELAHHIQKDQLEVGKTVLIFFQPKEGEQKKYCAIGNVTQITADEIAVDEGLITTRITKGQIIRIYSN